MTILQTLSAHPHLRLAPGLNETELRAFSESLPGSLPNEIRDLLLGTAGFRAESIGEVTFVGKDIRFEFKEVVPYSVPLAQRDGNAWVVDIASSGHWGCVFFFSHDPPTVVVQFNSLDSFIEALGRGKEIAIEADKLATEIWRDLGSGMPVADALKVGDPDLVQFASSLPSDFLVFDLRNKASIRGFAWGRHGPASECRRAGSELIFAAEGRPPKKALFSRLFK